MNAEEFIEKEVKRFIVGNEPASRRFADGIIKTLIERFRKHEYFDFTVMVEEATVSIKENTALIDFLSRGGTIEQFAQSIGSAYETARKRLNESSFAKRNTQTRPYHYYLKQENQQC